MYTSNKPADAVYVCPPSGILSLTERKEENKNGASKQATYS